MTKPLICTLKFSTYVPPKHYLQASWGGGGGGTGPPVPPVEPPLDLTHENNDYLTLCDSKISFQLTSEYTIKSPCLKLYVLTYEKHRLCNPL